MSQTLSAVYKWLQTEQAHAVLRASAVVLIGLLLYLIVRHRLRRNKGAFAQSVILRKVVGFVILSVTCLWALRELGLKMEVLLGAAGILTVALGFASQTSASNVISGFFLMAERPFSVGDLIKIGETTGKVLSIDFLSVKLRTFDNRLVRIPNESMLKTEFSNLTKFPIRRVDLQIGVAYKENVGQVRRILYEVADGNPLCLDEPRPFFFYRGYGDSALQLTFGVWTTQENYFEVQTSLYIEIKKAFDRAGIEIPFPHLSLYTGSLTDPMPVRLVGNGDAAGATLLGQGARGAGSE
ncbi:MAG TPA: mechanosensitive ion channel family protein [Myxococcota bacterium]|nr:mechanosensitive ion channel family protein [Myxococcota bacterium]